MSAELEQRLRDAFARLPKPTREATARARSDALTALGPTAARSRGALLLVAFAVAFVIGAGAAALAATGNLRVTIGAAQKATATIPTRLSVPAGSNGIAVADTSGVALIERWDHPFACVGFRRALGMNGLAWLSADTLLTGDNLLRGVIASGSVRSYRAGAGGTLARAGGAFRLRRLRAIARPRAPD